MSVESVADRHRKRIVEHTISGFTNASAAIMFGNTVERIVNDKAGHHKFRQSIGAPDTLLAITPEWNGPTVLKTTFLELPDDGVAEFICYQVSLAMKNHNDVHKASVTITSKVVRGKPQPQYLGFQ